MISQIQKKKCTPKSEGISGETVPGEGVRPAVMEQGAALQDERLAEDPTAWNVCQLAQEA